MKRLPTLLLLALSSVLWAQQSPLDSTLAPLPIQQVPLAPSTNSLKFSGYLQALYSQEHTQQEPTAQKFVLSHLFFSLQGKALEQKLSFEVQVDLGLKDPLLDAWIGYEPTKEITLWVGQKQTPLNNKELMLKSSKITFQDKGLVSSALGGSGRELGLFAQLVLGKKTMKLVPQAAFTTGDGRNVFSENLGGFKYGARVDFYPFGFFKDQKALSLNDILHEETPKLVLGGAYAYNEGVSQKVGEGQGQFLFLDAQKNPVYPNYEKLYTDLLFKYKGFSFYGEYATSASPENTALALHEDGRPLEGKEQELDAYLALGQAYNLQLSYTLASGLGLDLRYGNVSPSFKNATSMMPDRSAFSVGLTKHLYKNTLKLHTAYTHLEHQRLGPSDRGDLMLQLAF